MVENDIKNTRTSRSRSRLQTQHPAVPFVTANKSFDILVSSCFGMVLKPNWRTCITTFQEDYMACKISITPKAHILFGHVIKFIDDHKCGLGVYSEQSFETIHTELDAWWDRHKIKDKNNPKFGDKLLKTVKEFNASGAGC